MPYFLLALSTLVLLPSPVYADALLDLSCATQLAQIARSHAELEGNRTLQGLVAYDNADSTSIMSGLFGAGIGAVAGAAAGSLSSKPRTGPLSEPELRNRYLLASNKSLKAMQNFAEEFERVAHDDLYKNGKKPSTADIERMRALGIKKISITGLGYTQQYFAELQKTMGLDAPLSLEQRNKIIASLDAVESSISNQSRAEREWTQRGVTNKHTLSTRPPPETLKRANRVYDSAAKGRLGSSAKGLGLGLLFGAGASMAAFKVNCTQAKGTELAKYFTGDLSTGCYFKDGAADDLNSLNPTNLQALCKSHPEILAMAISSYETFRRRFASQLGIKAVGSVSCNGSDSVSYKLTLGTGQTVTSSVRRDGSILREKIEFSSGYSKAILNIARDPQTNQHQLNSQSGLYSSALMQSIDYDSLSKFFLSYKDSPPSDMFLKTNYNAGAAMVANSFLSETILDRCASKSSDRPSNQAPSAPITK